MSKYIKIGTRSSELALWQAKHVQEQLKILGYSSDLIPIKSDGDLALNKPLYEFGITGIFTRTLDTALINGTIDIAVHSMKDVPTLLPSGIVQGAVLERGDSHDVLIYNGSTPFSDEGVVIATGSLRRKAQWLHKYPKHLIENLRGNVNTRLKKVSDNQWDGAIFAKAGLERINLLPKKHIFLDWMIPAPAQGAIVIVTLGNSPYYHEIIGKLNHTPTAICTAIEREFLKVLEGGCTAPIGALAILKDNIIKFNGALFSLNGKERIEISKSIPLNDVVNFGALCAKEILSNGGKELMLAIRKEISK